MKVTVGSIFRTRRNLWEIEKLDAFTETIRIHWSVATAENFRTLRSNFSNNFNQAWSCEDSTRMFFTEIHSSM